MPEPSIRHAEWGAALARGVDKLNWSAIVLIVFMVLFARWFDGVSDHLPDGIKAISQLAESIEGLRDDLADYPSREDFERMRVVLEDVARAQVEFKETLSSYHAANGNIGVQIRDLRTSNREAIFAMEKSINEKIEDMPANAARYLDTVYPTPESKARFNNAPAPTPADLKRWK